MRTAAASFCLVAAVLTVNLLAPAAALAAPATKDGVVDLAVMEEVRALVRGKHLRADAPEQQLWTGAIQGMLRTLEAEGASDVNVLLSPQRLGALRDGISGKLSGVGVVIKMVEGMLLVQRVLDGSPGQAAGLQDGDRILAVGDTKVKGRTLEQLVGLIRGPSGSTVTLMIQRDTEEFPVPVVRGTVKVPPATSEMANETVGVVHLSMFSKTTPTVLGEQIAGLQAQGAKELVLDLRGCPGGLLDEALVVAGGFLRTGQTILRIQRREGEAEVHQAESDGAWAEIPMVVLVDGSTSSGGEILAAALQSNQRALLVGDRTYGKGTVEELFELSQGWAVKLTVARFEGPHGERWQGTGLKPNLAVSNPKAAPSGAAAPTDVQLDAALAVLELARKR